MFFIYNRQALSMICHYFQNIWESESSNTLMGELCKSVYAERAR